MAWWPGGSVLNYLLKNYQTTFLPNVYNLTQSGHSRIWWKLSSNRNMYLFPRTKHKSLSISNQNFKLQMTHTWWTWQTLTNIPQNTQRCLHKGTNTNQRSHNCSLYNCTQSQKPIQMHSMECQKFFVITLTLL